MNADQHFALGTAIYAVAIAVTLIALIIEISRSRRS